MGERYLNSVRLLAECLQGVERYSGESVRRYGLTHAQFDLIATLGNTDGMSYKELGERTLVTKGTLTGVIERFEQKGSVLRERSSHAGRPSLLSLQQKEES
jgi:DNA-binding MarR family transcriptional regulator